MSKYGSTNYQGKEYKLLEGVQFDGLQDVRIGNSIYVLDNNHVSAKCKDENGNLYTAYFVIPEDGEDLENVDYENAAYVQIINTAKTLEEIKKEIEENTDIFNEPDFINYIVETFGDYTYNGVSEIIVAREGNKFQAYANEKDSPIIVIEVEEKESIGDYPVLGIENVYVY